MEIEIPYDGAVERVEFPDGTTVLQSQYHPPLRAEAITDRIENGLVSRRDKFLNKKVSIIINDATRRVPTSAIINILLKQIPVGSCEILVATGTHRPPSNRELDDMLGNLRERIPVFIHDCRDSERMIDLGVTSRGTRVAINRKLAEAESVICINSVEPHFFAGFTGGRKSLVPGLAAFDTIVANHSRAKSQQAESLNLEDNPVHLDLEEAADLAEAMPVFSIQSVLSRQGEIVDLYCGDLKSSFRQACEKAREVYSAPIDKKYDLVFAVGEPPLDANLYQLQKAQEHGARAVADGGILVVVGACREGAGSPYFVQLADEYPDPGDALSARAMADNRFGIHKLIKTARRLGKIKIWYVTKVDDNIIRKLYFEPKKSLQEALRTGLDFFDGRCEIGILKDACFMVPVGA